MRATGEDVETVALQMLCVFGHCLGSEEETSPHLEMVREYLSNYAVIHTLTTFRTLWLHSSQKMEWCLDV